MLHLCVCCFGFLLPLNTRKSGSGGVDVLAAIGVWCGDEVFDRLAAVFVCRAYVNELSLVADGSISPGWEKGWRRQRRPSV